MKTIYVNSLYKGLTFNLKQFDMRFNILYLNISSIDLYHIKYNLMFRGDIDSMII